MADLPDYYTQTSIAEAEAASFKGGLEANLPADPVSRDIYLATDKQILYVCIADGVWTGFDAATLTQGILTLYANMVAGGYRLTGLGAPTAAGDALRYGQAEIRNAEIAADAAIAYAKLNLALSIVNADIAVAAAIAYSKLNLTGAIKAADIEAAAGIPLTKLEDAVCSETELADAITAHAGDDDAHHAVFIVNSGSYAGNDTVNRAIAHGLGRTPAIVIIAQPDNVDHYCIMGADNRIRMLSARYSFEVTIADATNFYVGNADNYIDSGNGTGTSYIWVAMG